MISRRKNLFLSDSVEVQQQSAMISTKVNKNLKQMLLKMEVATNKSAHTGERISICQWEATWQLLSNVSSVYVCVCVCVCLPL